MPKRDRTSNIFDGQAQRHRARIGAVDAVRLSVAPSGQSLPQSLSIATVFDWRSDTGVSLPLSIKWQQTSVGCWDFSFSLPDRAACLGLGERFSLLNVRGRKHTLASTDETKHTEFADSMYKAIPFLVVADAGQCYGVFLDCPAPQKWDLDTGLDGHASIQLLSRRGWQLYVLGPGSLPDIVGAYTELTGRHALPPLWSLGHQQCRWSYGDQATVMEIACQFRRRKIPCDTIVLDIDYMDEYKVFTRSKERFPDFDTLASKLDTDGFKLVAIVDPGVKKDSKYSVYTQSIEENLICKTVEGAPFVEEVWPGSCVFPDFERPDARKWWAELLEFYVDRGIAGIWNDMNEPTFTNIRRSLVEGLEEMPPLDEQLFVQRAPEGTVGHLEVRNRYGTLMCRATCEGLHELCPDQRPFVLTRSAFAGAQRYAAVWLGDNYSWWQHLRFSIPMLLNMGLSGIPFAGVDVGGFGGDCSAELLTRWYETGIFYPFFRNHCKMGERPQEPWSFGENTERQIKKLIETRYRLLPYLNNLFWEHHLTGAPMMRPLLWHYPDDPLAAEIDDQFLFGQDVLVAPIYEAGKTRRPAYFPAGRWYPLEGGEAIEGGRVQMIDLPLGCVPAFVKEGTILPLLDVIQTTRDYDSAPLVLTVFGDQAQAVLYEDDGRSLAYKTGGFRKWQLDCRKGELTSQLLHDGYQAPSRQYWLSWANQRQPVTLKP